MLSRLERLRDSAKKTHGIDRTRACFYDVLGNDSRYFSRRRPEHACVQAQPEGQEE